MPENGQPVNLPAAARSHSPQDRLEQFQRYDRILDAFENQADKSPEAVRKILEEENELANPFLIRELINISLANQQQDRLSFWQRQFPDIPLEMDTLNEPPASAGQNPVSGSDQTGDEEDRPLADYEIVEEIARGGMGVVSKAVQKRLNRVVALKQILSGNLASTEEVQRFLSEAEAAARLHHPNIVQVFDSGKLAGRPFFTMELIRGESLAQRTNHKAQPVEWSCRIIAKLADAVEHAHEHDIIHRDLKPSNVLLDENDEPKITDFGLAKRFDKNDSRTRTGDLLGTASYMAPEQAVGRISQIGPWTDVYGLGAIFYELLVGRPPFQGETNWDTISQVVSNDPVPPRALRPAIGIDVNTIVLKCLHKDPDKRYQTARELKEDVERYLNHEAILARPTSTIEHIRKWISRNRGISITIAVSLALLIVAISAGIIGILRENERYRQQRDQAVANLYESLLSDTRAQLAARSGTFWIQARDNLAQAASLVTNRRDDAELRNLAIQWMGNAYPCLVPRTLGQHNASVSRVRFLPDFGLICSSSADRELQVFSVESNQLLQSVRFPESITDFVAQPTVNILWVATADQKLHACRINWLDGKIRSPPLQEPRTDDLGDFGILRLTRHGENLVAGCNDGLVRQFRFSPQDQSLVFEPWSGNLGEVVDVQFSRSGRLVAAVGKERKMAIWTLGNPMPDRLIELERSPTCLTFCNRDQQIAWSDTERFSVLYVPVVESPRPAWQTAHQLHSQAIICLGSYDKDHLFTASADGTFGILNARSKRFIAKGIKHFGRTRTLGFDPGEQFVVTGYQNGQVILWEVVLSEFVTKFGNWYWSFFDSDGKLIGSNDNSVLLIDPQQKREWQHSIAGQGRNVGTWEIAPLNHRHAVARARHNGKVDVVSLDSFETLMSFDVADSNSGVVPAKKNDDPEVVWSLDVGPEDRFVFAGSGVDEQGFLNVIDLEQRQLICRKSRNTKLVTGVAVNGNAGNPVDVFSCSTDGSVDCWVFDPASGNLAHQTRLIHLEQEPFLSVDITDDGRLLAASTYSDRIFVWSRKQVSDRFSPEDLSILDNNHGNAIRLVRFVLDDQFLLSGSENGSIWFYPVTQDRDGRLSVTSSGRIRFQTGTGQIRCAAFSPNHRFMAVNSYNAATYVWDFERVQRQLEKWNIHWDPKDHSDD